MVLIEVRAELVVFLASEAEKATVPTGEAALQCEKEDLLLDLQWHPLAKLDLDRAAQLDEGAELRVTVLHKELVGLVVQPNYRLPPRDGDVRHRDVVVHAPAHVELQLFLEHDHVDGLRQTVNVRLQHDELLVLWLLVVEQLELLVGSDALQVSELECRLAELAAEFFPVVRIDSRLQLLTYALRVQPTAQAVQMNELHAPCTDARRDQGLFVSSSSSRQIRHALPLSSPTT